MKANEKQLKAIAAIFAQAEFWSISNDLESPTHLSEICSAAEELTLWSGFTDEEAEELGEKLQDLLFFIRTLKPRYLLGERNGQPYIECGTCGRKSFHLKDIEHKYCGCCHRFHEDF